MWKIKSLRDGTGSFAHLREYVWGGKLMRKLRIDETPQLLNLLRGDMRIVGIRPMEPKTYNLLPQHIGERLVSIKPGWFSLAGVFFMEEERILSLSHDPDKDYFEKILPMKLALDYFYLENRCFLLNLAIIYMGIKKALKTLWKP